MNSRNYNYITAEPLFAEVKTELSSYFESGALTELMLPTYVDQCLRKLKFLPLKPETGVLVFEDYKSRMPEDFHALDYAVAYETQEVIKGAIPQTEGYYYKSVTCIGSTCDADCYPTCDPKYEIYETITTPSTSGTTGLKLYRPRWIRVYYGCQQYCTEDCPNIRGKIMSNDVINILEKGVVIANFQKGCVYIRYYSKPIGDDGIPMIPEVLEIEEYVKAHIKFKCFEQLMNSVIDESFPQIKYKFEYYKQDSLHKLQAAHSLFLPTKQEIADNIVKMRKRLIKYHIQ